MHGAHSVFTHLRRVSIPARAAQLNCSTPMRPADFESTGRVDGRAVAFTESAAPCQPFPPPCQLLPQPPPPPHEELLPPPHEELLPPPHEWWLPPQEWCPPPDPWWLPPSEPPPSSTPPSDPPLSPAHQLPPPDAAPRLYVRRCAPLRPGDRVRPARTPTSVSPAIAIRAAMKIAMTAPLPPASKRDPPAPCLPGLCPYPPYGKAELSKTRGSRRTNMTGRQGAAATSCFTAVRRESSRLQKENRTSQVGASAPT